MSSPVTSSFGPQKKVQMVTEEFSLETVGHEYLGIECKRIANFLSENSPKNGNFICVCCPCYNEGFNELEKTMRSLLRNFEFLKTKTRFHHDSFGNKISSTFNAFSLVFVPIFDGVKPMSESCKTWFNANFENICEGIENNPSVAVIKI